jgi:hypothetical protein
MTEKQVLKSKEYFLQALNTLLFSWGMDTPNEAIWAANELLDWLEYEYDISIKSRFEEINEGGDPELVVEELKDLL